MSDTVNWDDFYNGIKYFGKDRLTFFMADGEAHALLEKAPEEIKRKVYVKCKKLGVAWPDSIAVDLTGIAEEEALFDKEAAEAKEKETVAEVITFACPRIPGLTLFLGKKSAQFTRGRLTTEDAEVIEAVRADRRFGIHISEVLR